MWSLDGLGYRDPCLARDTPCKHCGLSQAGHKTRRSKYCKLRPENIFEIGKKVVFSFPNFQHDNVMRLQDIMMPGWRTALPHWRGDANHQTQHYAWKDLFPGLRRKPRYMGSAIVTRQMGAALPNLIQEGPLWEPRKNTHEARVIDKTPGGTYILRVTVKWFMPWSYVSNANSWHITWDDLFKRTTVDIEVPTHFGGQRVIFPLRDSVWATDRSAIAMYRGYFNRGKATITGRSVCPVFKDISGLKHETAKYRREQYLGSEFYKQECEETRILVKKTCELPDDLFRVVLEIVFA